MVFWAQLFCEPRNLIVTDPERNRSREVAVVPLRRETKRMPIVIYRGDWQTAHRLFRQFWRLAVDIPYPAGFAEEFSRPGSNVGTCPISNRDGKFWRPTGPILARKRPAGTL